MKRGTFLFLIFALCAAAREESTAQRAGRYYFSEDGNDDNNGTSELSPWRSLTKLAAPGRLRPGDSVLLERGSVFFGTLSIYGNGSRTSGIYVGAYGSGVDPVIKGSVQLKNWKRFKDNIWIAHCQSCRSAPGSLYINGELHPPGRYPNKGYMDITGSFRSRTSFADENLKFPDHYWDGAEVVVRSSRWTIDNLIVSRYADKTFQFANPASDTLKSGFGYFIQKHRSTLDENGEWFHDPATNDVYMYSNTDLAAGEAIIEVSICDVGLQVADSEFVTVENLTVMNTRVLGAGIRKSNNVTLNGIRVLSSGANGLAVIGCKNPTVLNCTIRGANNNGVEWGDNIDGLFTDNAIVRTGMYPGLGSGGNGTYIGLSVTGANPHAGSNVIRKNRIDSTGYSAIDFRVGHTTIKNNLIRNFCLVKDDGGGIYTWGNDYGNNSIEGNIILYGRGSADGTPRPDQVYTSGIYIDDRSAQLNVTGNTVAFCAVAGIFVHNSVGIAILRNNLYGNGNHLTNVEKGQLLIRRDAIVPLRSPTPMNLDVKDNTMVSVDRSNYCLYLSAGKNEELQDPGIFSGNQYRSAEPDNIVAQFTAANGSCVETFTLPKWQAASGLDAGSSFARLNIEYPVSGGTNLIRNGTLTDGTDGWVIWPEEADILHERNPGHRSSLKALPPQGREALLYHPGFALDHQKTYRLSFSVKGSAKGRLEFAPLAATSPWHALGSYACFPMDTTYRTITWFFKPSKSSSNARANFKSNVTFWIADVSLREVISPRDNTNSIKLIYNTAPQPQYISLSEKYRDADGNPVSSTVRLEAYASQILFRTE